MSFRYTPLDLFGSKRTFTGRTTVISEIFEHILHGRSIGIFGERQIGKTLQLWMLRDIINGNIETSNLIDLRMKKAVLMPDHQAHHRVGGRKQGMRAQRPRSSEFAPSSA